MLFGALLPLLCVFTTSVAAKVTGCTCNGYSYTFTTQEHVSTTNTVLYRQSGYQSVETSNPTGWCFEDGVMIDRDQQRIQAAIEAGFPTDYVNTSWALYECQQLSYEDTTECWTGIVNIFTKALLGTAGTKTTYITQGCVYPADGTYNVLDCSCGFECKDGYTSCGTSACIDPTTQTCQSGLPVSLAKKRRGIECPRGQEKCAVAAWWGIAGYECLDVSSDLEACGGCPGESGSVDCSAIEGVGAVACVAGECVVDSCDLGYALVEDICIPQ